MIEKTGFQNYGLPGVLFITEADAVTLAGHQHTVEIIMSETGDFTITLAPPATVGETMVSIFLRTIDGSGNNITIAAPDGSTMSWSEDVILTANDDQLLLWCDGLRYHTITDVST